MTGVTGYIGFQTLIIALERGYSVRGVVRSQGNIVNLRTKSPLIAKRQAEGTLEFAIVPNFLSEGAFAAQLDGVTAIVHLASPLASQACATVREVYETLADQSP